MPIACHSLLWKPQIKQINSLISPCTYKGSVSSRNNVTLYKYAPPKCISYFLSHPFLHPLRSSWRWLWLGYPRWRHTGWHDFTCATWAICWFNSTQTLYMGLGILETMGKRYLSVFSATWLQFPEHHFHHILLVKQITKACSRGRGN